MSAMFFPVFYGSYRTDRLGIRLALNVSAQLKLKGHECELIDAREVDLPMLDRMYKEYPKGEAPAAMEMVADVLRRADGFAFVTGEYNWGPQPGLKNLTDHFLEEWFGRPAAVLSYSTGSLAGARSNYSWHPILAEMGMAVIPRTAAVPKIGETFDETGMPIGENSERAASSVGRTLDLLAWWTSAAKAQLAVSAYPG